MVEQKLDIIEFLLRFKLLKNRSLSTGQRTILKVTYGLPLEGAELELYCRATGRESYNPQEQDELSILAGRQSGKTTHIAAVIAVYEAFRDHGLPDGERGYVLLIAPLLLQAGIAFKAIRQYILESPTLAKRVLKISKNEIELRNGVMIACRPCSYVAVRGYPVICVLCDEMAFWRHEETFANPEEEVLDALRPAMATLSRTKIVKVSTPFRKEGILWREFQERGGLDHYVWQLSTEEMNPVVSNSFLEKARQRNEETFRREHLAEFVDNVIGWITPEILDPCVMRGKRELPRVSNGVYVAVIDPAFTSSDFGFAIVHRSDDGSVTVVYVSRWTGSKKTPLNFDPISEQIGEILRRYGINSLVGDQFCFPILQQHFQRLGIFYREFRFGIRTRASLYGNLRQLIAQQKIRFVDDAELLRQLRSLEELRTWNGNVDVRPPRSQNDDVAIAVALGVFELSEYVERPPAPMLVKRPIPGTRAIYGSCPPGVMPICEKFPGCWDRGRTCECMP